jgi:cystathionine beta-lyase
MAFPSNSIKRDPEILKKFFGSERALPFWVADTDFPSPGPVLEAIQKRKDIGIFSTTIKISNPFTILKVSTVPGL